MQTEEIGQIQNLSNHGREFAPPPSKKPGSGKKRCIYMREEECILPYTPFVLCKTCPYGYIYCFGAVVKNVYKKVIGISVLFRSIEDRRR